MNTAAGIDYFQEVVRDRYRAIEANRRPGQRVMGWMCSYFPEEIVYAAGMYPVRVLGGDSTSYADAYLHINMCSLVRACLDEALQGKYSFLDGFVTLNTCDNIRRLYDAWEYFVKPPFSHILALPHKVTEAAIAYFREELAEFKEKLEKFIGEKIADAALWEAIATFNRMRSLLQELDGLRREGAISGADFMDVVLAGMLLPKEQYIARLQGLVGQLQGVSASTGDKYRLLLTGSELDDSGFVRLIEAQHAAVVTDDLCTGSKYYWNLVEDGGDPLLALARRYLNRPPCPRIRPSDVRVEHVLKMVKSHRADAVMIAIMRFCKLHDEGTIILHRRLEEAQLPVLSVSREYSLTGTGAIKTRVEAFLESLTGV